MMTGKFGIIKISENLNNPIINPLIILFQRLNQLNGFLFLFHSHLERNKRSIIYSVKKGKFDYSRLFAGSALVIRDLSEFPANKWARYYSISVFSTEGEGYIKIADDLIIRESALTISQAYEAFETFLKNTTATFLGTNSNNKKYENEFQNGLHRFNKKRGKSLNPTSFDYWIEFINHSYKKNDEILTLLRKITPELDKLERQNNRALDLTVWYCVLTEVRHAITHSNLLIKNQKMNNWSQSERYILSGQINGVFNQYGYMLNPTMKNAKDILSLFAEYGFIIFKCLSKLEHYDFSNILTHNKSD